MEPPFNTNGGARWAGLGYNRNGRLGSLKAGALQGWTDRVVRSNKRGSGPI